MYWNVGGLNTNRARVEALMSESRPDVVFLFECRQSEVLPPRGFNQTWIQEAPPKRGGTVCWVRMCLQHRTLLKYASLETDRAYLMELIVVQVEDLVIGGTYISPQTPTTALSALLNKMVPFRRCVLVGDFNARHQDWCTLSKPRGRLIVKRAQRDCWTITTPSKPTFVQPGMRTGFSTIDLALVRGLHTLPVEMLDEPDGHRPLSLTVVEGRRSLPTSSTLNDKRRRLAAITWYEEKGLSIVESVSDPEIDLDKAYATYEDFVLGPFRRKERYPSLGVSPLDDEIHEVAQQKKRALRQGETATAGTLRRRLRSLVRQRRRLVGASTNRAEPRCSADVAKNIRRWTGARTERAALGLHLAPETFSQFLQQRSGSHPVNLATPSTDDLPDDFLLSLQRSIREAPINKAVGTDAIRAEFLKLAPMTHAHLILLLLRRSLAAGRLPSRWSDAIVRPLLKPGKPASDPASYRPVSILSHVRKIVEASLLRYLLAAYQPHDSQFAYIPGRKILTAVKRVDSGIREGLHTVCLDLTSAFDLVDKHRIENRLGLVGLRPSITTAILLNLSSTKNSVKVGNTVSVPFFTTKGVPQGGCLSPVLFLFVMDALASKLAGLGAQPTLYSDDVAIQGDPSQVERALLATQDWEETEGMKISIAKTWTLTPRTFYYKNTAIQHLSDGRYLGLTLDSRGLNSAKSVVGRLPRVGMLANSLRFVGGIDRRAHPIQLRNLLLTFVCGGVRYGEQILDREAITSLRQAISKTVLDAFGMRRVTWATLRALLRFREIGQTSAERLFEAVQTETTLRTLLRTAPDTGTSTLLKALPTKSAWFLLRWWTGFYPDHRVYGPLRSRFPQRLLCWETLAKAPSWNAIEKRYMVKETAWLIEVVYGVD